MSLRVGGLFAGYGGLDLGLSMVLDAEPVWFVEFDKHPSAVLAHHWPDVPNHGDITAVDWAAVEPVDILTGGFPCQDVSTAGLRRGIKPGTRSGLWEHFAYAISILKPRLVVVENVSGLLSADAHCDVEPCPWCVGDEPDGHMRALGAVLADLAEAGFDAEWCSVRASDTGAPHRRERVFIVAADAGRGQLLRPAQRRGLPVTTEHGDLRADRLMPTPVARDSKGRTLNSRQGGDSLPDAALNLLPTPAVNDMGRGRTPQDWDDWTQAMRAKHGNGNGHGKSLEIEAQRLLPTPTSQAAKHGGTPDVNAHGYGSNLWDIPTLLPTPRATDGTKGGPNQRGSSGDLMLPSAVQPQRLLPTARATRGGSSTEISYALGGTYSDDTRPQGVVSPGTDFGPYAAAIHRWEQVLGRPAPSPTEPGRDGRQRLSPAFVEFMMGLPAGHVTGTGIPRNAQLKALGNGVVPQQAALALSMLLPRLYVCGAAKDAEEVA